VGYGKTKGEVPIAKNLQISINLKTLYTILTPRNAPEDKSYGLIINQN
jgi:hypothetical protein